MLDDQMNGVSPLMSTIGQKKGNLVPELAKLRCSADSAAREAGPLTYQILIEQFLPFRAL